MISGAALPSARGEVTVTYTVVDSADPQNSDSAQFTVTVSTVPFDLDVDASGEITVQDGILIARYLLGARGQSLLAAQSAAGDSDAVEDTINAGRQTGALAVGDRQLRVNEVDGILIARYLLGLRGAALTKDIPSADADSEGRIEQLLQQFAR